VRACDWSVGFRCFERFRVLTAVLIIPAERRGYVLRFRVVGLWSLITIVTATLRVRIDRARCNRRAT